MSRVRFWKREVLLFAQCCEFSSRQAFFFELRRDYEQAERWRADAGRWSAMAFAVAVAS